MRAHGIWGVRAASASGHALARIVHRVLGILHRVVRFRLDHCHHVSAYGDNVGGGMHSMWMMHVAREQWDLASAFALQLCARWLSSGPADSQPVASDTRNHMMLLTCERMLLCECMCASLSRLACVQRACRACCARVCSCARRRAASAGVAVARPRRGRMPVLDMPLLRFVRLFFCTVQNALQAYAKQAAIVPCSEPQPRLAAAARTHRCCQLATRRCA